MSRVFLSHSSKDKGFYLENVVRNLTKYIGRDNFVYDAITFEEGEETELEISKWLEKSDIFVLFISDTALKSKWVEKEILQAKEMLDQNVLSKIYPIIIDNNITHEDKRIPEWMRERYNLHYIGQPSVAARKIHNKTIEIVWRKNPKIKEKGALFVGRNDYINSIEARMDSFEKAIPTTLIASGLTDIGRRSILRRSIIKSGIVDESYQLPAITLDAHQSIEDFILLLLDLGYGKEISKYNLTIQPQEEKVNRVVGMLQEMKSLKEILLVVDNGAIVSPVAGISEWFVKINKELSVKNVGIVLCIVSKHKAQFEDLARCESMYAVHVNQLTESERSGLLTRYSRTIELDIPREDIRYIASFFTGMPKEIIYTADYIKHNSVEKFKRNTNIVSDFTDNQVSRLISKYESNKNAKDLFALISTFDFISFSMLYEITQNNYVYTTLIEEFLSSGICEELGVNGEYIYLNSAIKNYVQRQKYDLDQALQKNLENHVISFVKSYDNDQDRDVSDIFYSIRKAITDNYDVDSRFLIPSHYLKSMKELYDRRDKDQDVVILADRILINEKFMDPQIAHEIRYFLCSSLARLKEDRFKEEVQKIKGPEHNFLFGFYYRHVGRDSDAIQRLMKALEDRPKFSRAKRELVLVYNNNEEYDKAVLLAKENYEDNRDNEYHIHAYFQCLSYGRSDIFSFEERKEKVLDLIDEIKKIESEKAKSMALIMSIQYKVYFEDDLETAEKLLEEHQYRSKYDIFLLLCMFDVYEKLNNKSRLKEILFKIKALHGNSNSKYHRDYLKCLAIYKAMDGDIGEAKEIISKISISDANKILLENKVMKISNK